MRAKRKIADNIYRETNSQTSMACPLMLKEIEESPAVTNLRQIHSFIHLIPISIRPTKTHSPRKKHTSTNQKSKNIKIIQPIQHPNAISHQSFLSPCIINFSYFLGGSSISINIPSPSNFVWRLPRRTPHPTREAPTPPASRPHLGWLCQFLQAKGKLYQQIYPPDSICGHRPNPKNPPGGPGLLKAVSFMTCWKNF